MKRYAVTEINLLINTDVDIYGYLFSISLFVSMLFIMILLLKYIFMKKIFIGLFSKVF